MIGRINNHELQEVAQLDDTQGGDQGFTSSATTKDQRVMGQNAKPRTEINEILARAFRRWYQGRETTDILKWNKIDNQIQLEAINIRTELAIKNEKDNEEEDVIDTFSWEYHHLLDVFEKRRKWQYHLSDSALFGNWPRARRDRTSQEDIRLSYDEVQELHWHIKLKEHRGWIQYVKSWKGFTNHVCQEKDGKLGQCANYRALNEVTKQDWHPLPLISETLDRLAGAKYYYIKLDIKDGYHNIWIREGDQW